MLLAFSAVGFLVAGWAAALHDFNAFSVAAIVGVVSLVAVKVNVDALCDLVKNSERRLQ